MESSTEAAPPQAPTPNESYSPDDFLREVPSLEIPEGESTPPSDETPPEVEDTTTPEDTTTTPEDTAETPSAETQPDETGTPQTPEQKLPTRPYEKFPAEWRQALRKMSSPAFSIFEKNFDELQTAKAELAKKDTALTEASNARWFTHDSAWLLNPEVTTTITELRKAEDELQFVKQQLLAVESNQPWINRFTDAAGNQQEQQVDPSPEAKLHLQERFYNLRGDIQTLKSQYATHKSSFKKQVESYNQVMDNLNNKIFPNSDTPQWKQAVDTVLNNLPPFLARTREMNLLAKALLTVNFLKEKDAKAQTTTTRTATIANAAKQAGKLPGQPQALHKQTQQPSFTKRGIPTALEEATSEFAKYGL